MKKLVLAMAVISGLIILNSCEKQDVPVKTQEETFKVNFDKFSVGVENNTLVFDSEADLQGCIDYLVEIGEDHFDEFEKSLGYHSFRSTGKELNGYDEIMKTLINPNLENVICGYLTVSDFEKETAVAYKLEDDQLCDLANVDRSTLARVDFTFDDDFFEFVKYGAFMKAANSYCIEWIDTDNEVVPLTMINNSVSVLTKAEYSRSFFYKYLQIFYQVHTTCDVSSVYIRVNYTTKKDSDGSSLCYYNTNDDEDDDDYFERSEEGVYYVGSSGLTITFDRKPFTGTSKLERYKLEVDYYLEIGGVPYTNTIYREYNTNNFCLL